MSALEHLWGIQRIQRIKHKSNNPMNLNIVFQIESSRAMVDYGSLDSAAGHSENLGSK